MDHIFAECKQAISMNYVLITGVSTGIGNSLAKKFLAKDYAVFGSVRTKEDADKLEIELGENFHPLIFDVTNETAINLAFKEVEVALNGKGLAGLINNSGIAVGGVIQFLSISEYKRQFDVNVFGLIAVTKAFLPLLGAVRNYSGTPGRIINISSVSGKVGYPFLSPYCASKFAVEGFSESLRREMLLYGIDVITIGPGPVKTPIWRKSDFSSETEGSSNYRVALGRFRKYAQSAAEKGLEPDDLSNRIFQVFKMKRPKTNYIFLKRKFLNYTVPKVFLTPRILDRFIGKMFK